jgi:hypothetical protein
VADVELVAHALAVVLDFGQQLALGGVVVQVELALDLVADEVAPLALLVDLEVDLHVDVQVHLQVLLLRHHLAQLLPLLLRGLLLLQHVQVGVRLLLQEGGGRGLELVGGSDVLDESLAHGAALVLEALLVAEELGLEGRHAVLLLLEVEEGGLGLVLEDGEGLAGGAEQVLLVVAELVVLDAEGDEVGVLEGVLHRESLRGVHLQAGPHEAERVLLDLAEVAGLDGFGPLHIRQLYF